MNTVNAIATDTAVKGVSKQPIADAVGFGKTNEAGLQLPETEGEAA